MSTKTAKITEKVKKMAKKAEAPKTDKDALKATLLKEVNDKKEKERLERIEKNKEILESTVYTKEGDSVSKGLIQLLKDEGVAHIEKNIGSPENPNEDLKEEVSALTLRTNQNQFPVVVTHNDEHLFFKRDFKQPNQVIGILRRIGVKEVTLPSNDLRILEGFKNMASGIAQQLQNTQRQIQQIQQQLGPISQFINKLKAEVEAEDKGNEKKSK